jgi:hypothetical protein
MCSTGRCCGFAAAGFPIRTSSDQRLYTASRGLSQCPTSFIGIWRQGIHRKLLVASPRDAEKLILFGLHQKSYKSVTIQLSRFCFAVDRRAVFFTCVKNTDQQSTLFFRQDDPAQRRVVKLPMRCEPTNSTVLQSRQLQTSYHPFTQGSVEMTGFEPVAFALQRRCSPAELHPRALPETSGGPDWIRTSDPSLIRTVL